MLALLFLVGSEPPAFVLDLFGLADEDVAFLLLLLFFAAIVNWLLAWNRPRLAPRLIRKGSEVHSIFSRAYLQRERCDFQHMMWLQRYNAKTVCSRFLGLLAARLSVVHVWQSVRLIRLLARRSHPQNAYLSAEREYRCGIYGSIAMRALVAFYILLICLQAASGTNGSSPGPQVQCIPSIPKDQRDLVRSSSSSSSSPCSSYNLVAANGDILLRSAEVPLAVCVNHQWATESNGGLVLLSSSISGSSSFRATYNVTSTNNTFTIRVASHPSSSSVIFSSKFHSGLSNTSGCTNPITDPDGETGVILSGWPSFRYPSTTYSDHIHSSLSWRGTFMSPMTGQLSTGPKGGPALLFGDAHAVISSPLGEYGSWSAGPGSSHDGFITDVWNPGMRGTIEHVPPGFASSTIFFVNSSPESSGSVSITDSMYKWGSMMLRYHNSTLAIEMNDVTLQKIGYQTDNGAYFCFCKGNCSDTLLKKVDELRQMQVPMGYLSFQGVGASVGHDGAPWCVDRWGPDGGLGPNYPLSLSDFQRALGLPLQFYAPYFCFGSTYFNSTSSNGAPVWPGVRSDASLPGCKGYDFWNIDPSMSEVFYDWLFSTGKSAGMVSYEPDFMNQNRNCMPSFRQTVDGATRWQRSMNRAASKSNTAVQWCMATPIDVLTSLEFDYVTNFRVSTDYCYGESWRIGISSLLVSALGKAPSKDTLWTTPNNRTEIPGCPWTADHEESGAALHVTLALFSSGPVGISDGPGFTDGELIRRIISADGTLLQPSRPATLIDSLIRAGCSSDKHYYEALLDSEILVSHSSSNDDLGLLNRAWYVISFRVHNDVTLNRSDLYPSAPAKDLLFWRHFDGGASCRDGQDAVASGCIVKSFDVIPIPASDFSNTTIGTDFGHVITTVYPSHCESGWLALGELTKLVPLSTYRFPKIQCTPMGIRFAVVGSPREIIDVTAIDEGGVVRTKSVRISQHLSPKTISFGAPAFTTNKLSLS